MLRPRALRIRHGLRGHGNAMRSFGVTELRGCGDTGLRFGRREAPRPACRSFATRPTRRDLGPKRHLCPVRRLQPFWDAGWRHWEPAGRRLRPGSCPIVWTSCPPTTAGPVEAGEQGRMHGARTTYPSAPGIQSVRVSGRRGPWFGTGGSAPAEHMSPRCYVIQYSVQVTYPKRGSVLPR